MAAAMVMIMGPFSHNIQLKCPIEVELGATAAVVEKKADLGAMMSEMTSEQGERGTLICKSCHTFNKGGPHLTGPNLWDIVNRPVGKVAGYTNYSDALKNDGGIWSYDRLDAFLKNSTAYIPGTAMAQKVRKDDKRAAMLVYLSTLSDSPVPFPALLVDQIESTLTGDDHSEEKTEDPGH